MLDEKVIGRIQIGTDGGKLWNTIVDLRRGITGFGIEPVELSSIIIKCYS